MRRSIARRAAVFGSAALLLLGPVTAVAQADPVAMPEPGVAALPPQLGDAVQRDLQLTPEQYLQEAALGQELAGFTATARAEYADVFAGAWLDRNGTPVVGLADGAGKDAARSAVRAAGFQVNDVAKSESELRSDLTALNDWLDTQPAEVANLVRATAIDIANNDIVLRADAAATGLQLPDFLDAARIIFAPTPLIRPRGAMHLTPVADLTAPDALFGGDAYAAMGGGNALRCSLGFNATDGSGNPVNITAGHCDPNRPSPGTGTASEAYVLASEGLGPKIGTFTKTSLDNHDYSLIAPTVDARHRFENNGVRIPMSAPLAITGTADPVVGAPVCKSGVTTGYSCGTVNAVDQTVQVGARSLTNGFSTTICALQGDSGGTIVTGTLALGVSSASNVGDYQACELANAESLAVGEVPELFGTPIREILRENPGLRIRTG